MATASDRIYLKISLTEAFRLTELLATLSLCSDVGETRAVAVGMREVLNKRIDGTLDEILL